MPQDHEWSQWWSGHVSTDATPSAALLVADALEAGQLTLPRDPSKRIARLAAWGRADPTFARLAAGHVNAVTILAELGGPPPGRRVWGVWTVSPQSVTAAQQRGGWMLSGLRPDCVGTDVCRRCLLTARTDAGICLYAADVADLDVVTEIPAAADGGRTVALSAVPGLQLGDVDAYACRPGRWRHRVEVAACWYGGALGLADLLPDRDRCGVADLLSVAERLLTGAAARIETLLWSDQRALADHVCRGVRRVVVQVIERVEQTGPSGDRVARRLADLRAHLHMAAPVGAGAYARGQHVAAR
jgi:hypothetical protein